MENYRDLKGQMDGRTDGLTDRQTDGRTDIKLLCITDNKILKSQSSIIIDSFSKPRANKTGRYQFNDLYHTIRKNCL